MTYTPSLFLLYNINSKFTLDERFNIEKKKLKWK